MRLLNKWYLVLLLAIVAQAQAINTDGDAYADDLEVVAGSDPADANDEPKFGEVVKLLANNGAQGDFFGISVSIDGDTAVVGANFSNIVNGFRTGSAYVFTRADNTWEFQQELTRSFTGRSSGFGTSVSIDGDSIAIGSPFEENGAVYVFSRNAEVWTEQQRITVSGTDKFGSSVSLSGTGLLVGAPDEHSDQIDVNGDPLEFYTGYAYFYRWDDSAWNKEQKLQAPDFDSGDRFGNAVDLEGDYAVVGAYQDDITNTFRRFDDGSAHVFYHDGQAWTHQQKLVASDASGTDEFGTRVSINSEASIIVVGTPKKFTDQGRAYIFENTDSTWTEKQTLFPSDTSANMAFGSDVVVDNRVVMVSAQRGGGSTDDTGSVYVFTESGPTWTERQEIYAGDGSSGDRFGYSIDLDNGSAIVGAYQADTAAIASGEANIFELQKNNDLGSDSWQLANGFDPNIPNDESTLDSDGDGDPDIWEIFQGTARDGAGDSYGFKQTQADAGTKTLSTQFRRSTLSSATSVVTAVGKWSPDLQNWYFSGETVDGVTVTFTENPTDMGDYEIVDVDVSVTSGETPQLFYSLELIPVE